MFDWGIPDCVLLGHSEVSNEQELSELDKNDIRFINSMSHYDMAYLYRFTQPGNRFFDRTKPLNAIFMERFISLGGMTPYISKKIGW